MHRNLSDLWDILETAYKVFLTYALCKADVHSAVDSCYIDVCDCVICGILKRMGEERKLFVSPNQHKSGSQKFL